MRDGSRTTSWRIAYFSPLPPERSGIAGYSEELLPYLAQSAQVTLFASDPEQVAAVLRAAFEVRSIATIRGTPAVRHRPLSHGG